MIDGRALRAPFTANADVVVVGSGPAGAAAARVIARAGARVVIVEEGHPVERVEASGLRAMVALYRDMGTSVALGPSVLPYLQGRVVGGTSVINGAICWRLPEDVWRGWVRANPAIEEALPWDQLQAAEAEIDERLGVAPTDPAIAGPKNLLLARGAEALGLEHRPIRRNVAGCQGSGRCLQGCPHGAKASVDRNLLVDAVGAELMSGVRVERVVLERGRAAGVVGRAAGGGRVTVRAQKVVLAASAIQTPRLLQASGLRAGAGLMAHPGVSVTGRFAEEADNLRGATQGHEVTGLRHEGLKIEALGFDEAILASRVPGVGAEFARRLGELRHYAVWGAAIRAEAQGTVGRFVRYALTMEDLRKARRGVRVLCELFLAAGAEEAYPGVAGMPAVVRTPAEAAALESGPLDARAYAMSMTHLFATARLGDVVGADFQHRDAPGVYVADSSVFPSNTGVNPQVPIMAVATLCGRRVTHAP